MYSADFESISLQVSQVFTPNTPIDEKSMFSGRIDQIRRINDVVYEKGQHAIIFGDRGVGKTSIANVISKIVVLTDLTNSTIAVRINCDAIDDFASIWR